MKIEAAAAESAMPGRCFLSMHNVVFHGCRTTKTASMSADVTMIARSRLAVTRYISRATQVANKMPTIGDATLASSVDRTVPSLLSIAHPAASVRAKKSSPTTVSYTHLRAHETPEHLVCRLLLEKKKTT